MVVDLRAITDRAVPMTVASQAIGKYEQNESVRDSSVLLALADALDVTLDYLAGEQEMVPERVEFRKKQITSKKEEAQVQAQALHRIECYSTVEEALGFDSDKWDQPRDAPYRCASSAMPSKRRTVCASTEISLPTRFRI